MQPLLVRKAQPADLPGILELYATARKFMQEHGNPTQWGDSYPPQELLQQDMAADQLYVETNETGIHGVFVLMQGEDPMYRVIEQGKWLSDAPYMAIHRVAGDGTVRGVFATAVAFALRRCPHLRVDTHAENRVMQACITKAGFTPCGIVYTETGSPRIAYERL